MKLKMFLSRKTISYQNSFWWLILGIGIILTIKIGIYTLESLVENIKTLVVVSKKEEISNVFQAMWAIIKIFTIDLLLYYVFMLLATKIIQHSYLKISRKKRLK